MADEPVLVRVERRDDGVAVVTLDNPKVNALSSALLAQLKAAAEALTADPPGAVVVTGGDRVFAAGADISEFGGPHEAAVLGGHFVATLNAIASIPRMTIAAVSGYALGGGCEVALACDLRIVSEKAKFGQPEILLGIIPGGGATQRLARLVGVSRARRSSSRGGKSTLRRRCASASPTRSWRRKHSTIGPSSARPSSLAVRLPRMRSRSAPSTRALTCRSSMGSSSSRSASSRCSGPRILRSA